MKLTHIATCSILSAIISVFGCSVATAQFSAAQQTEIAILDAATMVGKSDSWIRGEKEAAIQLFEQQEQLKKFVETKIEQYSGKQTGNKYFDSKTQDRIKQLTNSLKNWNQNVPRYLEKQPAQIASELKRQRDAVARYKKSKTPRPSSFAYIPKTVWETKDKLQVLTAAGYDTSDLQKEQEEVEKLVLDLVASIDAAELAKKNNAPRDAYKQDDRAQIETFVKSQWKKSHEDEVVRIVMPASSWSNTYGLNFSSADAAPEIHEVDRMTVYVATRKTDEIVTLHPMRLKRFNFKVHGKLLGRPAPEAPSEIPTNEFSFDVLEKNIR